MNLRAAVSLVVLTAAAVAPAAAAPPSAQALAQKQTFVQKLVEESPVARRIRDGQSEEARRLLATAGEQYRQAVDAERSGDLAAADKLLNDAIWNIGRARQLSPDLGDEMIHRRAEYSRLIGGLDALRASYLRHLQRSASGTSDDRHLARVDGQLERARTLAAAESFAPAVRLLQEAERGLVDGISKLLGSATLLYSQRFDTLQEEYAFEVDRNRGYEELVPLALRERRPPVEVAIRVDHHVDVNRALRDHARRHAERAEWTDALMAVRRGTAELQRALALAGVVVPTEMAAEAVAQ